jgi:hypothetical protein
LLAQRADTLQAQQQADQLAADQAAGDQKAVAKDLYDIQTTELEKQAKLERTAADASAAAAQQAYQDQRDALKQTLQDAETLRETARQVQADAEAQAYQDQRDAQWQALSDLHDDQVTAFGQDLAQWGEWIGKKQRTYAQFLAWLADNPIVPGNQPLPTDWSPDGALMPDLGFGRPHTAAGGFAGGGKVGGRYIGREDTILARVTPGEHVASRQLTAAMEDFFIGGGARGPSTVIYGTFLGATERQVGRSLEALVTPQQARVVRYNAPI